MGIFYITWHSDSLRRHEEPYAADVTKVLAGDPAARLDAKHPLWTEGSYHWGEPEMGYFLSKDEYVIRKDMSMLADAGVDVLVMDVTNAVRYWDEWDVVFPVMQQMKAEGNKVPQFCFWAFNGPAITVVQDLYDKIYKADKYKDLWFYWDGKPLLLYNGTPSVDANGQVTQHPNPHYDPAAKTDPNHPHYGDPDYTEEFYKDYTKEVKEFFTLRTMWWGYYEWAGKRFIGTEDNWSFGYDLGNDRVKAMAPDELVSTHNGVKEEAAVTPAQHPSSLTGKCWTREHGEPELNEYDLPVPTHVPWLGKTVEHPEGYGIYFQQRWDEAIAANPQFLYINDWNEWTAGKYQPPAGRRSVHAARQPVLLRRPVQRRVQPLHPADEGRLHRQLLHADGPEHPALQGHSAHSGTERPARDHDRRRRCAIGRASTSSIATQPATSSTATIRATADCTTRTTRAATTSSPARSPSTATTCTFAWRRSEPLTPHTDNNWMLLLIDADQNHDTGWYGYDYLVNKKVVDAQHDDADALRCGVPDQPWVEQAQLKYCVCRQRTGAGRAASAHRPAGRRAQLRFSLVRQSGRPEGPDFAVHERRQRPEPAVQLSLHLEEIVRPRSRLSSVARRAPAGFGYGEGQNRRSPAGHSTWR